MSAYVLVNPSRHHQHGYGADHCGHHDGDELGGNDIKIEHQCHAGRHEEEAEIGHKEIAQSLHPFQLYPLQLQQQGEREHPDDARRQLDACQVDDQLSDGETSEEDCTLSYHTINGF